MHGPLLLSKKLLPMHHASLSDHLPFDKCSKVSVADLRPVHFPRHIPRPVSCYTLFKGWLLLSLPPGCLWDMTKFYSLSQHFGTLTLVCVVPLLDTELIPIPPLPTST